jgi:hypothetical protein
MAHPVKDAVPDSASTTESTMKPTPALKFTFPARGTRQSRDLAFTRRFHDEFRGLQVVQTDQVSLMVGLGGKHRISVVYTKRPSEMRLLKHNGHDVETNDEVDATYKAVLAESEQWKPHNITKPVLQHGTYGYYFWDADKNYWETSANPQGRYDGSSGPASDHLQRTGIALGEPRQSRPRMTVLESACSPAAITRPSIAIAAGSRRDRHL